MSEAGETAHAEPIINHTAFTTPKNPRQLQQDPGSFYTYSDSPSKRGRLLYNLRVHSSTVEPAYHRMRSGK